MSPIVQVIIAVGVPVGLFLLGRILDAMKDLRVEMSGVKERTSALESWAEGKGFHRGR